MCTCVVEIINQLGQEIDNIAQKWESFFQASGNVVWKNKVSKMKALIQNSAIAQFFFNWAIAQILFKYLFSYSLLYIYLEQCKVGKTLINKIVPQLVLHEAWGRSQRICCLYDIWNWWYVIWGY